MTKITIAGLDAIEAADAALDEMTDHELRSRLRKAKTRRDFAGCAADIASDRYNAGSTASLATIYVLLTHGVQAAMDFQKELEHHEG